MKSSSVSVRKVIIQRVGIPFHEIPHNPVCNDTERGPVLYYRIYSMISSLQKKGNYIMPILAAYIVNVFCVSVLMSALWEGWKNNS